MIRIEKGKKIWLSSDFHGYHINLCRGISKWKDEKGNVPISRTRDFRDLKHMNDTIINNINSCVGQDDVLIFLGDFSFGGFENIKPFRERIICKTIHLILGNHDHHIQKNKDGIQSFFASVSKSNELIYDGSLLILSHYPYASWEDLRKGSIMLFGHLHSSTVDRFPGEGKIMDVGIDGHPEFRPYSIDEIMSLMKTRPIMSLLPKDHHGKIKVDDNNLIQYQE
jgi:calcineurin-like phosphoesterase family protein